MVMEPSEIVNVLARASELQAKIDAAIGRASPARPSLPLHPRSEFHEDDEDDDKTEDEAEDRYGDSPSNPDVEKLTAIRDALLDLQDQLDSLQALQKKQKFEREDHLVELEERRKHLIRRLREYNGTEWEIVQEAHVFVGEPVQGEDDLVLPPYQSSVRDVHALGDGAIVNGLSKRRQNSSRKSSLASRPEDEEPKQGQDGSQVPQSDIDKAPSHSINFSGFVLGLSRLATRAGEAVRFSAKTALVIAGIVFAVSQLEVQLKKLSAGKALHPQAHGCDRSRRRSNRPSRFAKPNGVVVQDELCPLGKILLVQDGVQKCFVKERIEVPFKEVIKQPDASYGYG